MAWLPGQLTPRLHERLVRLGTGRPFAPAAEAVAFCTGVTVAATTVRRLTEGAGAADEAVQTAAVETIERELPATPSGPRVQRLSVDGAMVPLQQGEWAAVKTLAIGTVRTPVQERGEGVVHTEERSYVSRLTDAETVEHLALVATHRRGTETAKTVCAVSDGAEWMQGVVDPHRPDAVRILDFPHALGYVAQAGQAVHGEATTAFTPWFVTQRHTLPYGHPAEGLGALRQLATPAKGRRAIGAIAPMQASLRDLEKRREMLDDAWCHAKGYPIGSGRVESANTLVVERRLKGTGMHWARAHVNPMVALRTIACRDRWPEAWPQIAHDIRHQYWQDRVSRQMARRPSPGLELLTTLPPHAPVTLPMPAATEALPVPPRAPLSPPTARKGAKRPSRPPPEHPWRRFRIGRARSPALVAAYAATL